MNRPRAAALLTGLAAALALAGCGVPPSGVIQAGDPATGLSPGLTLYFLSPADTLRAVPRPGDGGTDPAAAVRLLFAGPTDAEAGQVRTQLPRTPIAPQVSVHGSTLVIGLPGLGPLSRLGVDQLVCTATAAWHGRSARQPGGPATEPPLRPGGSGGSEQAPSAAEHAGPPSPPTVTPVPTAVSPVVVVVNGDGWTLPRKEPDCPSDR
ncbi:hypothetical protein [Streptomyces sp. CA-111067]|uniref:hypothetical protein n=1 Tax=Streptomyces sp. CA-111067 TaxID=3240046 RepID=UPI003D9965F6